MRARLLLCLLFCLLVAAPAAADVIPVAVELRPEEITVGGRVEAKLTLVWDGEKPAADPRFPEWEGGWGDAEVLQVSETEAFPDQSGRNVYIQRLTLTSFEVGEVKLPRQTVALPLAAETIEIPTEEEAFQVTSVLPETGSTEADPSAAMGPGTGSGTDSGTAAAPLEPRPPAPLIEPPATRRFFYTALVLALLTLGALHVLLTRLGRIRPTGETALSLLPPLDELLRRLGGLENAAAEPAHTGMSLALRTYLGRSLGLHAVEGTTTEIQRRLRVSNAPPGAAQQIVGLLRDCDQVKFAGVEVTPVVTADRVGKARNLARDVEAEIRVQVSDEGDAEAEERRAAELERETKRKGQFRTRGKVILAVAGLWVVTGVALEVLSITAYHAEKIFLLAGVAQLIFGLLTYHRGRA